MSVDKVINRCELGMIYIYITYSFILFSTESGMIFSISFNLVEVLWYLSQWNLMCLQFILPYLLGWHAFANAIKPEDSIRSNNMTARSGAELEWGR